jgi:hypothetical protein
MAAAAVFATVEQRNKVLSDLAAADAFHDFNTMSRISAENRAKKENVMPAIWKDEKKIGTLHDPNDYAEQNEEAMFQQVIGIPLETIKQPAAAPKSLTVLNAGQNSIEYEWQTVKVGTRSGDGVVYEDSINLFKTITGSILEETLYFMIDAINVNIHAALINDKGPKQGEAVYISSRERTNDSAGNRDLTPYVEASKESKISLKVVKDTSELRATYSPMKENSTDPLSLFNSIFSLLLESKTKTKEGLESSILTFKRTTGALLKTITAQTGVVGHENAVNSLYGRLVNFFKSLVRKTDKELEDYFIALQQKRSGDWLQVLSTFQKARYTEIPASAPVFLATEDRLCLLYGLCVGANMIYTFHRGDDYYITVFRRKQKRTSRERRNEMFEVLKTRAAIRMASGPNLETGPVVPGGLAYQDAVSLYLHFQAEKVNDISGAAAAARATALGRLAAIQAGRFSPKAFDELLRAALLPLYTFVLFMRAFPFKLEALADIHLAAKDITKGNIDIISKKLDAWESTVATLQEVFQTIPTALNSEEEFRKGAAQLYAVFEASNKERDEVLRSFTAEKELYEQTALGFLSQLAHYAPQSLLDPLEPIFAVMITKAQEAMAAPEAAKRKQAGILRMNGAILQYLLIRKTGPFPAAAVPSFSNLLSKTFEKPATVRKGNIFAVHRLLASAYQRFVASKERAAHIDAFLKAFNAGAGAAVAAPRGGARTKQVSRSKQASKARKFLRSIATTAIPATRKKSASTSLERSFKRGDGLQVGIMSSLIPLYLAVTVLEDFSYSHEVEPYRYVGTIRILLTLLARAESAEFIRTRLAAAVSKEVFDPFYRELVGYFLFTALPNATTHPILQGFFGGNAQVLMEVEELGRILKDGVIGAPVGISLDFSAEHERVLGNWLGLALTTLRDSPLGLAEVDGLRREILLQIRKQEGFQKRGSSATRALAESARATLRKKSAAFSLRSTGLLKRSATKRRSKAAAAAAAGPRLSTIVEETGA